MSDHERLSDLFLQASALPPSEREAFLQEACAGEPELLAEILALLTWDDRTKTDGFIERVVAAGLDGHEAPERIGPYRLLQPVGEGGMGQVWLAEQTEPMRRKVALKIVKAGMDTQQVIARFEAERQALALMDHPSIAKVFDAGETLQGRPYFVMEYVQGVPITQHCDRLRLTTRERLDLFVKVCEGVQHAHQKAIIHRDLKPSNILVAVQGDRAVPKIIDFGVAKATSQRLTEKTMFTALGMLIGTPEYMSPEQAEMTGQDVDTRTDVYALGVILYELIVGALPFDPEAMRSAGFAEIVRKICEDEPPKPSTRLSSLGERSTESASHRRVDVKALRSELEGDLDWITMKALEKDRTRRYGSPSELAADIERHLTDQPVLAGPPSRRYRARKFIRRHRVGVAVAAIAVVVLIAFAATMTVQARRIAAERDRANSEKERANQEAQTAQKVSDFLAGLFGASSPSQAQGKELTARQILDRGVERIEKELADQPAVRARLLQTLGRVHSALGQFDKAESLLSRAVKLSTETFGGEAFQTLQARGGLAWLHHLEGKEEEAAKEIEPLVEAYRRQLGSEDNVTLRAMNDLANIHGEAGHPAEAEKVSREILEIRRRTLGDHHVDTYGTMVNVGWQLYLQQKPKEAEGFFRPAYEGLLAMLGPDHPETQNVLANLAMSVSDQGRNTEAEVLIRKAYEGNRRVYGDDHPDTIDQLTGLAGVVMRLGRYEEAERLWRQAYEFERRKFGEESAGADRCRYYLGLTLSWMGRYKEAEALLRQSAESSSRRDGDDSAGTSVSWNGLAVTLSRLGRYREAESILRRVVETRRRVDGQDSGGFILPLANLGYALTGEGRSTEADAALADALTRAGRTKDDKSGRVLYIKACAEALRGRKVESMEALEQANAAGYFGAVEDKHLIALLEGDPRFNSVAGEIRDRRLNGR